MNNANHSRATAIANRVPPVAAGAVALIALLVLIGWTLDIELLKSLLTPERIAMNPMTAAAFLLSALALWTCRRDPPSRREAIVSRLCAAAVVLIAICRFGDYFSGWNLGIDHLLFRSKLGENQMAPNTAAAFLVIGLALMIHDLVIDSGFHPAQLLIIAAGSMGLLSLTGYLYRTAELYGVRGFIPMALNTAICFGILSAGALCTRLRREPLATAVSNTLGGVVARRLIPAAFLVPLLIGWLRLQGERRNIYSREFGAAFVVLANILAFNALIWWSARVMHKNDLRRRSSEDELRSSEQRYRAIMEQAAEGIYLVDLETKRVLDSNEALERLLGYAHGEAESKLVYDFIDDTPQGVASRLRLLSESGEVMRGERNYRRKDGTLIEVESGAALISYEGRHVACTVVHDITDRKRAERDLVEKHRQLQQAMDQLQLTQSQLVQSEKLAGLGEMVAGVAHEINNPLSFVSNNVAVLQRDLRGIRELLALYAQADALLAEHNSQLCLSIRELSTRMDLAYTTSNMEEILDRSREGLRRIQQIVKDLRDFARLDESDLQEVDLNAGIESTINIVRGKAKKKQVQIDLDLNPLPLVVCYPAKVNQVIMNLVANAIDASPEGGVITVHTSSDPEGTRVSVTDNGRGVDPAIRHRIFDPFFTTKPQGEGTGLGLSISYGIVHDHGGRIEVTDAPGGGAVFAIFLPRRDVDAK